MKIVDSIVEDWLRIRKWFQEVKNLLFSLLLVSAFLASAVWISSISIVNLPTILGIISVVVLYASAIGIYAYVWYIQKQLKEKEAKITSLEQNLRKVEDENLVLKTKIETIEQNERTREQITETEQTEKFLKFLEAIAKIKEPTAVEGNVIPQT